MSIKKIQIDWLNPKQKLLLIEHLAKNQEIPDYFTYYSRYTLESFAKTFQKRMLGTDQTQTMFSDFNVVVSEAEILRHRFRCYNKINLFEIVETVQEASLAFAVEFLEEKNLQSFTCITPRLEMNLESLDRLKNYCQERQLKVPVLNSHLVECEWRDFKPEVDTILKKLPKTDLNLFLLLDSRLGNSPDPMALLHNIYQSMPADSYLVIVQSLFRNLNENAVILDYQNLFNSPDSFVGNKEFASLFVSPEEIKVEWSSQNGIPQAIAAIKTNQDIHIENLEIRKGVNINIFRSYRFKLNQLTQILEATGFKIQDIHLNPNEAGAMFLASKV